MPTESGGTKSRSGGMSVSLAGPDGRVLGGGLAGLLVAAGPVQVEYFFLGNHCIILFLCYRCYYYFITVFAIFFSSHNYTYNILILKC